MTGIPPSVWADEGDRAIATALELVKESADRRSDEPGEDEPQMSG